MAYLEVSAFKKLRAFFWGLQNSSFNLNRIPAKDNEGTPIDKAYCLNLLHSFPDFQGEQFKDDNFLVKYLSKPGNLKQILDQFTPAQQIELTKVFEEKPVAAGTVSEQPVDQTTSAEQGVPAQATGGEQAGTMTGGLPFPGIAAGGAAATAPRRIIRNIPRAPEPTPGTTTTSGASAKVTITNPAVSSTTSSSGLSGNMTFNLSPKTAETAETTQPAKGIRGSGRRFQTPKIPTSIRSFGSAIGSRAGIFLNRNIIGIARTGLGVFAGGVLTGGNPLAMLGGGIGGATFNAWGRKVLDGSINAGVGISNQVSRGSFVKGGSKKIVFLFLGGFLLLAFGTAFLGALNPGGSTGPTPTPGGGSFGGGSIASCRFTRSDQSPPAAQFKSQTLLGYFQEASVKSGVPVTVLAGIARIESPGIVNFTDDNLASYGCPTSETGAKGLMQVQPPGTTGYSAAGVSLGAQYLGVTVDQLNFCDLRQNIFLGAGVVNVKVGGSWDSTKTNDKSYIDGLSAGYYGCLRYGGPPGTRCDDPRRNYSYGDDLFKSISECRPPTPTPPVGNIASCPVVGGVISTPSYNTNRATGHCGDNYTYTCHCGTSGRRAKAIDVRDTARSPSGIPVKLPQIGGQNVDWNLITKNYRVDQTEGGGVGNTFKAVIGTDTWYLDTLHLNPTTMVLGDSYRSGAQISTTAGDHVHTTIGKNLSKTPVAGSDTDCDTNWVPSDSMCQ